MPRQHATRIIGASHLVTRYRFTGIPNTANTVFQLAPDQHIFRAWGFSMLKEMTMKRKSASASTSKRDAPAKRGREPGKLDSSSGNSDCPREQVIAEAAYFRAERRNYEPGDELPDWLQAETDMEGLLGSGQ